MGVAAVLVCLFLAAPQVRIEGDGNVADDEAADIRSFAPSSARPQIPLPRVSSGRTPHVQILSHRAHRHRAAATDVEQKLETSEVISLQENHIVLGAPTFFPVDPEPRSAPAAPLETSTAIQDQSASSTPNEPLTPDSIEHMDNAQLRTRLLQLLGSQKEDLSAESSTACECTTTGLSGSVMVPNIGCARHDDSASPFCYVKNPDQCKSLARASTVYVGASWRYCDMAEAVPAMDKHTKLGHVEQDGLHKYTLEHSGVKTTLVTEGNKTLTPEQSRQRSQELLKQAEADHIQERANLTETMNSTRATAEAAMAVAMDSVSEAMDGAMESLHTALRDALGNANSSSSQSQDSPSFDTLFNRINSRVFAATRSLRPPPVDKRGNVKPLEGRNETIYDRMMSMSDRIIANMDQKMKEVSQKVAQESALADSPVSVTARTDD